MSRASRGSPGGLLLVDKPAGVTSTGVVRICRKALSERRVGHAGTLDPDASGLLLVCVGECTKAVPFLMDAGKRYEAKARLGAETETDDASGRVLHTVPFDHVGEDAAREWLEGQTGTILQTPPRVSALKVRGRRLYERVRAGESVDAELLPRPVLAGRISLVRWDPPDLELTLEVGKGFYVRSLVRDLGRELGTAAHMTALRRTDVGRHSVTDAVGPSEIDATRLLPTSEALSHLGAVEVDAAVATRITNGQRVAVDVVGLQSAGPALKPGDLCRVLGPRGLIAVARLEPDSRLRVVRGFAP